jgi:hypothetical protein
MKNVRFGLSARSTKMFVVVPIVITLLNSASGAANAALESDNVGFYGSVLITRSADKAARAMKALKWAEAQGEYIKLTGMKPNEEDFYVGLYCSSHNLGQWDQVMRALSELFALKPEYKERMTLEYGEACYHLNRYDEAEIYLKKALGHVNEESFLQQRLKRVLDKGIIIETAVLGPVIEYKEKPEIKPVPWVPTPEDPRKALTLENAFMRSEAILVCTFKSYEKGDGAITFFNPPKAIFKIDEELKTSARWNPIIPVRFEFHEDLKEDKPEGWNFSPDMMPKKGSKWIIFIPNSVPVDGAYKTYQGKFGMIPYSVDEYDKVLKIIKEHQGSGVM